MNRVDLAYKMTTYINRNALKSSLPKLFRVIMLGKHVSILCQAMIIDQNH